MVGTGSAAPVGVGVAAGVETGVAASPSPVGVGVADGVETYAAASLGVELGVGMESPPSHANASTESAKHVSAMTAVGWIGIGKLNMSRGL